MLARGAYMKVNRPIVEALYRLFCDPECLKLLPGAARNIKSGSSDLLSCPFCHQVYFYLSAAPPFASEIGQLVFTFLLVLAYLGYNLLLWDVQQTFIHNAEHAE